MVVDIVSKSTQTQRPKVLLNTSIPFPSKAKGGLVLLSLSLTLTLTLTLSLLRNRERKMALEAMGFQKELYHLLEDNWEIEQEKDGDGPLGFPGNQAENFLFDEWCDINGGGGVVDGGFLPHFILDRMGFHCPNNTSTSDSSYATVAGSMAVLPQSEAPTADAANRPKRRRRSRKNQEEIENQRMTHIAVERNRRKQMNEYLSVLRSLMPPSYVQRGDQASIIGGAINFVKELEQQLHLLGAHTSSSLQTPSHHSSPFSDFFSFPQYSTSPGRSSESASPMDASPSTRSSAVADVEVSLVDSHASLKIRSKKRQKQLLKLVSGLESLRLTVLHLNVSTADGVGLYTLSLKVEDDCKLTSGNEIATAVHQILARIQ